MEIIIRAYKDHDFETLEKIRNNFELQYLLLANPKPNTKLRVLQWIENKTAGVNSVFFVISNDKDDTIGYAQATELDLLNRNCYFGVQFWFFIVSESLLPCSDYFNFRLLFSHHFPIIWRRIIL
jgi:hypothetical protein